MNKNKYFIVLVILLTSTFAFGQKGSTVINKESNWQDRVYFGGGFGLQGGSWGTSISLSPIVGYMVNSRVSVGVGVTYQYYKYSDAFYNYTDNRYGGQVFARVNLIKQIFAYGDYSFLNYSFNGIENDRRTVYRLPLGLGMSQPIGSRSSINFIAAYDVLHEINGPYASPWVFSVFFSI